MKIAIQKWKEGNFKIKALKSDYRWLTKDKIYEFKDGRMTYDEGQTSGYYLDFNDYTSRNISFEVEEYIETEVKIKSNEEINTKPTFEQLSQSPIDGIELNSSVEDYFKNLLMHNGTIVYIKDVLKRESITYNNLPIFIKWLQNVYSLSTELKSKIEYIDFNTAKEHMNKGNKTEFENETYYIKNNELWCEDINDACALKLRAIESDKWILL